MMNFSVPKRMISLVALILGGCQFAPQTRQLTVSAASSLQTVLQAIEPEFEKAYPQIDLTFNFAASGVLQRQIEQGAPVDVFFSAAPKPINSLLEQQLIIQNSHRSIVTNQLALIVPEESQVSLTGFQQLTSPQVKKIMVGEEASVPAGQYAQEVFSTLELSQQIQTKLIFANSVQGVLAAVAGANVDAGVVYATDVRQSDRVKQVALAPAHSHSPIVYPIAIVAGSSQPQTAQSFIEFLSTPESKDRFTQAGFGLVPED
ncbi:molybdate ABC transporter substrate-binding protein [Acaryochloris marina NIES-2412]|uniref:molybdate ABC transporter substrate-binding protein n=1 Tax=Acaryochloris marina TaxID=155978 RepID=UPI0040591717